MKKNDKYFGKLNEYLDGELTASEVEELEKALALDADLRKKLAELKAIKERVKKAYNELHESPYFETRLYALLNEPKTFWSRIRKFVPAAGLTLATLCLMFILKYQPQLLQNFVEEQSSNISGFYKQNLRPLLFAADLSNEDIFNFAFYHQLPLNKANQQYLHLGYDPKGNEFFEIKTDSGMPKVNSLNSFVKALDLNASQKQKVDSILQSYASELESQVLINEKNTVAINPNIWNYNKALLADLLSFAESSNKKEFDKICPSQGVNFADNAEVVKIVRQVKSSKPNQYIFFTPDSVFSANYSFDKKQFAEEMKKAQKELKNTNQELQRVSINLEGLDHLRHSTHVAKNFNVRVDSTTCRVNIPLDAVPDISLPDFDALADQIDKASRNFRAFTFEFTPKGKNDFNFNYKDENGEPFDVRINIDSLVNNPHILVQPPRGKVKRVDIYLDSMMSSIRNFMPDSLSTLQQQEFRKQMKELEKEMKRFRQEMRDMQKEFREKKQNQKNDPLEI